MHPADVVEFYGTPAEFMDMGDVALSGDVSPRFENAIPAAVEHFPRHPTPITELPVYERDDMYEYPPEIAALLESREGVLADLFHEEGCFNAVLVRLDRVEDGTFVAETTSYYRSFVTNLAPDFDLYKHRTFRELVEYRQFADDGSLRDLARSDLSDHLGISALIVTTDGEVLLPRRGLDVAVDRGTISESVGGSVAAEHGVKVADIEGSLLTEMDEELGIPAEHVLGTRYVGTVRRMEMHGSPSICAVVTVDADAPVDDIGTGSWETESVTPADVVPAPSADIETLFTTEAARTLLDGVADAVSRDGTPPSVGLLTVLWLYAANADLGIDVT